MRYNLEVLGFSLILVFLMVNDFGFQNVIFVSLPLHVVVSLEDVVMHMLYVVVGYVIV